MTNQNLSIRTALKEDPLFGDLSTDQLAKLAGSGELCSYKPGEILFKIGDEALDCYVVISGEVKLLDGNNNDRHFKQRSFGEEAFSLDFYISTAVAVSDVTVLRIDKQSLSDLKVQVPMIAANSSLALVSRHSDVSISVKKKNQKSSVPLLSSKEKVGWLLSTLLPLLFYFLAQANGFSSYASIFIAIISAVILMWSFSIVDEFIPPVVAVVACVLTGLAPTNIALSGFATPALLTLLGVYALAGTVTQSGLSYRIVLILLKKLPKTAFSNQIVLLLSGYLLSFVTPSGNNRISLLLPVYKDMVSGLKLGKHSLQGTGLLAATFGGAMLFSPMLAVSKSANITAVSLLPDSIQQQFLGFYWLYCAIFCLIGITAVHIFSIRKLFPATDAKLIDATILNGQLECLGPMKIGEKLAAYIFVLYIIFCTTYSIHQIDLSALSGILLISLLLFGIYSKVDFKNLTDWPMIFFLLGVDSLMNIMSYLGLDRSLASSVQYLYQFINGSLWLFILAACATTLIIRLALPLGAGMLTSFAILLPVALNQHIHPWICLFVCAVFSDIWFFPYQSSVYLQAKSSVPQHMYSERGFLKYNMALNVGRLLVIFASIPWWIYLGLT